MRFKVNIWPLTAFQIGDRWRFCRKPLPAAISLAAGFLLDFGPSLTEMHIYHAQPPAPLRDRVGVLSWSGGDLFLALIRARLTYDYPEFDDSSADFQQHPGVACFRVSEAGFHASHIAEMMTALPRPMVVRTDRGQTANISEWYNSPPSS